MILYETTPGVRIEGDTYVVDLGADSRTKVGLYLERNHGESIAAGGSGEDLKVTLPVEHAVALRDGLTRWLESINKNPCPACGKI
jgi:hypothetical protein